MAATFQVTGFTGTLKSLSADYWSRVLGAAGAWESEKVVAVSVNDYLTCTKSRDILVMENDNDVTVKFVANTGGSNGQGIRIPLGFDKIKIAAVNGTVKVLGFDKQQHNTEIVDAYSNANAVTGTVDLELYPGDIICCSSSGYFSLNFKLNSVVKYQRVGLDIIGISSEKVI